RDSKAKGYKTIGATITALGSGYSGGSREQTRQRVNQWIRTSGTFDLVVDFDQILRNPSNQAQLAQQYNSGDGLHPNVAGFQAIADNFPLDIFRTSGGTPTTPGQPGTTTTPVIPPTSQAPIVTPPPAAGNIPKYGQCGGNGWT